MTIFQSLLYLKIKVRAFLFHIILSKNAIFRDIFSIELMYSIVYLVFQMVAVITGGRYIRIGRVGEFCKIEAFVAMQTFLKNFVAMQYICNQCKNARISCFICTFICKKISLKAIVWVGPWALNHWENSCLWSILVFLVVLSFDYAC